MQKISIIIPIYNEVDTLNEIIQKIESTNFCNLEKELILVDDGSTDGTHGLLQELEGKYKVIYHEKNKGKGAAIATGLNNVTGDIIVIQDADLEYDPADYPELVQLIIDDKADAVYGSRLTGARPARAFMFTHLLGNKFLTFLTNLLYNATLTDMETCYKAFRADFIKDIVIKSKKFDFEPEITSKILKKGARLYELPISYYGRDYAQGKKITWKDGLSAIWTLLKYRFIN